MSKELYACICAEEFPAQALLRLRTDLAVEAVAVWRECRRWRRLRR